MTPAARTAPPTRLDRRTRAARSEQRDARQALLEAAAHLIAERGFRDASVEEIARAAGFSKGAVYWHFEGKDDLLLTLLEERIDRPMYESFELLGSAPAEDDMAPEANRLLVELLQQQRESMLLLNEYRSLAARDPAVRERYVKRQAGLRAAWARGLEARMKHLGAPPVASPDDLATALMALVSGLAFEKLVEPEAVPDHLLGETLALIYAGHVARSHANSSP